MTDQALRIDQGFYGASVCQLPGAHLRNGRHGPASSPCVKKRPRPHHTALDPPVTYLPARRGDAEMQMTSARSPGAADPANPLSGVDSHSRSNAGFDARQVRPVVAGAIITENRHRDSATGGPRVDLRAVGVRRRRVEDYPTSHRDHCGAARGHDVGGRIVVMLARIAGSSDHRKGEGELRRRHGRG